MDWMGTSSSEVVVLLSTEDSIASLKIYAYFVQAIVNVGWCHCSGEVAVVPRSLYAIY